MENITINVLGHGEISVPAGTTLGEAAAMVCGNREYPVLIAKVDNDLHELFRSATAGCEVEFLDVRDTNGFRVYQRSAAFMMVYAAKEVLGRKVRVVVEHSINKNYYCSIQHEGIELTEERVAAIEAKMRETAEKNLPIEKYALPVDEAMRLSEEYALYDKVRTLKYRRASNVNFYKLDWLYDYFYGHLAPNTGCIGLFKLVLAEGGKFILQMPDRRNPESLNELKPLTRITKVFQESGAWAAILKADTVGALNDIICAGGQGEFVRVNEALHEKKIASLADMIHENGKKIVLIAGPSSSGKTTFAERLGIQLRVNGLIPLVVSLDDYYLDRDATPLDEDGKPDYETVYALDIPRINEDFSRLLAGESVRVPSFNFRAGKREYRRRPISLNEENVLVVEGIHGLNEKISESIPKESKFKIVISALTQLNIDDHNRIPTSDTRLIRRIVRDSNYRGFKAEETLAMWPSVLRGEQKFIFPFQEEADAVFNSALVYELCVLKHYVEPILFSIPRSRAEYTQARRLVKFLECFVGFPSEEVPANSILREFIGGSCFRT